MGNGQTETEARSSLRPWARDNLHPNASRLTPHASRPASSTRHGAGWVFPKRRKGSTRWCCRRRRARPCCPNCKSASAALLDAQVSSRLREAQAQLTGYLAGTRRSFDLSLDLSRGTSFQRKVWRTLRAHLLRPASILSMGGASCWRQTVCACRRQCCGGESDADRDSLPSNCGAGYVARRILRRLAHETKTAHSRRNPGGPSTGTILTHEGCDSAGDLCAR